MATQSAQQTISADQLVAKLFEGKLSGQSLVDMCGDLESFKALLQVLYEQAIATYDAFDKNQVILRDNESAFFIGMFFRYSDEKEDFEIGAHWLKAAGNQGFAPAQYWLGECYQNVAGAWFDEDSHVFLGVDYDDERFENGYFHLEKDGADWFEKAAEQGFGVAQYRLGYCYIGMGRESSPIKIREWTQMAAAQGVAEAIQFLKSQ